jgi:hypothetical protein
LNCHDVTAETPQVPPPSSDFSVSAFQRFSEANELAFLVLFCSQLFPRVKLPKGS